MSNAVIGALRVNLGLDSAQFTTGVRKSQKEADTFATRLQASFKKVAVGFAAVGAAASAMAAVAAVPIKKSIDAMDDLSKAAQKVGSSAEDLAKLRFAADLSGVSAEGLEKGLTRLNVALNDLSTGATSKASMALRKMGVEAGTTSLDAVRKLAAQFEKMPDGVQKSALAVSVFGKAGADLIPLLNSGEAGIAKMAEQAERFGLVVDTQTLRAAEAFNDNLTRLGAVVTGVTSQIAAGMVPALASITDALVGNINTGNVWVSFGQAVGRGLVNISEAAYATAETVRALSRSTVALYEAGRAILSGQGFGAAGAIIGQADAANMASIERRQKIFADLRKSIADFKPGEGSGASGAVFSAVETGAAKAAASVETMREALAKMLATAPKLSDALVKQSRDIAGFWADFRGETQTIETVLSKLVNVDLEALRQNLPDMNEKLNRAMESATRFGEGLAQNLSQALVFGQSLGQALVSSIRAAAAELLTSGLLNLLLGERGGSGQRSGGLFSAIGGALGFFANGTPSAPGGLAMVGERGRELVQMPRGAKVWSNRETEAMMSGRGGQQRVVVDVQPSPLFVTTVRRATESAAAETVGAYVNQQRRTGMAGSFG